MKALYYPAHREPHELELLGRNPDGTVELGLDGKLVVGKCKVVSPLEVNRTGHCSLEDKIVEPKKK